jgi:ABC-type glycerol-3-phosphate transport system substrate-binding protein
MNMPHRRSMLSALALTSALLISLCGCGSSSKASVTVKGTTTISTGQELLDLKRALDEGAISQRDYDKVRAILLDRKS